MKLRDRTLAASFKGLFERAESTRLSAFAKHLEFQYVSNIYKYYVAYKLVVEQGKSLH